ncbi:hypothetical protein [Burkholderia sp. MBR-1]|uniref:hypothetical protein n=1 Tax=Burkholderia sp. MBR-1 TaxID=2732364 RepID=UPI0015EEA734|nr:hypothetical protein [Burkholderia sp. MBR-1]
MTTDNSRADALRADQRQALREALSEYFGKLDSDEGIRAPEGCILRAFDYYESSTIDDLIDRAIVPALLSSSVEQLAAVPIDGVPSPVWWINHGSHGQITTRPDVANRVRDAGASVKEYKAIPAHAPAVADLPRFPTVLRKMWSGGEVQQWMDDNIKPPVQQRHHDFHRALERAPSPADERATTGLGWRVREHRALDGTLLDCFVEAPAEGDMPYGLQVLGDDYTGYGDIARKHEHCKMIVAWANRASSANETTDEGAAFVRHQGYERPEIDGASQEAWDYHRKTWTAAIAFANETWAQGAKPIAWMVEADGFPLMFRTTRSDVDYWMQRGAKITALSRSLAISPSAEEQAHPAEGQGSQADSGGDSAGK